MHKQFKIIFMSIALGIPGQGFMYGQQHNNGGWDPKVLLGGGIVGGIGIFGVLKIFYNQMINSQYRDANQRLQGHSNTIDQITKKYEQTAMASERLEQEFTCNNGIEYSNRSIREVQGVIEQDLSTVEKLLNGINTERAAWQGYPDYKKAINERANKSYEAALQLRLKLQRLYQDTQAFTHVMDLRILVNKTQKEFAQILSYLGDPRDLNQTIRTQFSESPYAHLRCKEKAEAAEMALTLAESKVTSDKFSSFVSDGKKLCFELNILVKKITNTNMYIEQLRKYKLDEQAQLQTIAAQKLAAAEEQRARTEAERARTEQARLQEERRNNNLQVAKIQQQDRQMAANAANTLTEAIAHSGCRKTEEDLRRNNGMLSQNVAEQKAAVAEAKATIRALNAQIELLKASVHSVNPANAVDLQGKIQTLTAQANSLRDSVNTLKSTHASKIAKAKAMLLLLGTKLTPLFNPDIIQVEGSEPGAPNPFVAWHDGLKAAFNNVQQELNRASAG